MSPGVCVLSLMHFGTPKLCSPWLHTEVEQGYMWPAAGVFVMGRYPQHRLEFWPNQLTDVFWHRYVNGERCLGYDVKDDGLRILHEGICQNFPELVC